MIVSKKLEKTRHTVTFNTILRLGLAKKEICKFVLNITLFICNAIEILYFLISNPAEKDLSLLIKTAKMY